MAKVLPDEIDDRLPDIDIDGFDEWECASVLSSLATTVSDTSSTQNFEGLGFINEEEMCDATEELNSCMDTSPPRAFGPTGPPTGDEEEVALFAYMVNWPALQALGVQIFNFRTVTHLRLYRQLEFSTLHNKEKDSCFYLDGFYAPLLEAVDNSNVATTRLRKGSDRKCLTVSVPKHHIDVFRTMDMKARELLGAAVSNHPPLTQVSCLVPYKNNSPECFLAIFPIRESVCVFLETDEGLVEASYERLILWDECGLTFSFSGVWIDRERQEFGCRLILSRVTCDRTCKRRKDGPDFW